MSENTHQALPSEQSASLARAKAATRKLLSYCESRDWAGYDPYDALNSRIFKALPFLDHRIPRLVLSQALKRSVFDIRPLLLVEPTQNPKALGLFLTSVLNLSKVGLLDHQDLVGPLTENLEALRSPNSKYWCWGYSFPWQTRTLLVPRGAPNLVCTTFVANALLDAYEQRGEARFLDMAASSASYLLDELFWTEGDSVAGFAYPLPTMRNNVHNGNLLGAALLCRVARHTGEKMFTEPALKVARYSASRQKPDGSWLYGESPAQGWIDNFHTGYNLCALRVIANNLATTEFDPHIRRGFEFYRGHFFREDGAPRYFHDRTYPLDIHSVAQSMITLIDLKDLDPGNVALANSVFEWAMKHMWDDRGFFYYRILRSCTIRTSYMRWSQAWMLLAMSALLCNSAVGAPNSTVQHSTTLAETR
jgi:hypothetical protein